MSNKEPDEWEYWLTEKPFQIEKLIETIIRQKLDGKPSKVEVVSNLIIRIGVVKLLACFLHYPEVFLKKVKGEKWR